MYHKRACTQALNLENGLFPELSAIIDAIIAMNISEFIGPFDGGIFFDGPEINDESVFADAGEGAMADMFQSFLQKNMLDVFAAGKSVLLNRMDGVARGDAGDPFIVFESTGPNDLGFGGSNDISPFPSIADKSVFLADELIIGQSLYPIFHK